MSFSNPLILYPPWLLLLLSGKSIKIELNTFRYKLSEASQFLIFWKFKYSEIISGSFYFLNNSSWLLFFALIIILFLSSELNIC